MLYENISYPDRLPFRIFFSNIVEENYHYHKELEMSFVLRGTTHYKIHHLDYALKRGSIIIVDSSDLHRIFNSSDDILMLTIQVDLDYFSDQYPAIASSIFVCEIPGDKDPQEYQELQNKNKVLKRLLTKIMIAYQQQGNSDLLLSYVENLVSTLVEQFQDFVFIGTLFKPDKRQLKDVDMRRYLKLSDYMYTNYQEPISLQTISDYLHLSPYYVSHLVKNISGLSFKNYLNYVRVEYSEKLLAEQVLTLTEICETCGFSSLTYFNKCFSFWHGKTPAQYRKELPSCTRRFGRAFSEAEGTELLLQLSDSYRIINHSAESLLPTSATIQVDFQQSGGTPFRELYRPRLLLRSADDAFFLSHYGPELHALHPAELLVRRELLSTLPAAQRRSLLLAAEHSGLPVTEWDGEGAQAAPASSKDPLADLLSAPCPIAGEDRALVYGNGLLTPLFHILRIFAGVSGDVTARQDNALVVRHGDVLSLLICKTALRQETAFNVIFKNAPGHIFITEQRFENNRKFRSVLDEFARRDTVPGAILEELNTSFHNRITYTLDTTRQNLSMSLLKTGVILLKITPYT